MRPDSAPPHRDHKGPPPERLRRPPAVPERPPHPGLPTGGVRRRPGRARVDWVRYIILHIRSDEVLTKMFAVVFGFTADEISSLSDCFTRSYELFRDRASPVPNAAVDLIFYCSDFFKNTVYQILRLCAFSSGCPSTAPFLYGVRKVQGHLLFVFQLSPSPKSCCCIVFFLNISLK